MTLWSPNLPTPHVRLLAHLGPLTSISVDPSTSSQGRYLATSGLDGRVKIWDQRNYARPLKEWTSRREIASLAFSQRGLLAIGAGSTVQVYDDGVTKTGNARSVGPFGPQPYLTNVLGGRAIRDVSWCPFEDVLGVGTNQGFQTLLVPGAGEPNFDSGEADMYESAKRRREREVRNVLEKVRHRRHLSSFCYLLRFTLTHTRPPAPPPFFFSFFFSFSATPDSTGHDYDGSLDPRLRRRPGEEDVRRAAEADALCAPASDGAAYGERRHGGPSLG